ncbi:MAG TPA: hypothetical protein VIJ26_04110 [Thermoanaerobaculia bacterium]
MTKELIKAEIDRVDEERLDELYDLIRTFTRGKKGKEKATLMDRLIEIKIDGPEDFATRVARLIR